MKKIDKIPRVVEAELIPPYGLRLAFDDGLVRDVDLADDLWGTMFEPLKDPAYFAQVVVDHGTVVCPRLIYKKMPNGLDLDPLVLHGDFDPAHRAPSS